MRLHYTTTLLASLALAFGARALAAQTRWKEIGKTSSNNPVFIDPASVKTKDSIITARVQVKFVKPVKTPKGDWVLSRHVAMFNCARHTIATKSSYFYGDAAATKVMESSVPKIPGFGPTFDGSMTQVAFDYVCKAKK